MAHERLILDAWTPLSFKRALGTRKQAGTSWLAPTWVGDHARRLQAYTMLQAYIDNAGREYLAEVGEEDREEHREYGDAALISETIRSALLGDSQEVFVEGSDKTNADGTASDAEAVLLQEWLQQWASDERFQLKMIEAERNAVNLGDGVYTLGWSSGKGRPRLRVFDPGFYFPVLDDGPEDDYPNRVHIAWEMETPHTGERKLRRITWELLDLPNGETRNVSWSTMPSTQTCYMTDATWTLQSASRETVDDMTGASVEYAVDSEGEIKDRDLGIDFIPVVHIPNTVSLLNHYGQSSLSRILQIVDDLANADTDLQRAAATTGFPPIAVSGARISERPTYRPGQIFDMGDGRMDVMDTSRSLDALLKYTEQLLERLSVNGRVPSSLLGRVKPSEVPSGVALALSFGPLSSMINEMRIVRGEKYALLFKFVYRLAAAAKMPDVPALTAEMRMTLKLGSYLPHDTNDAVTMVRTLLGNGTEPAAVSLESAVRLLAEVGLPIDDVHEEILQIQHRDFKGASALLDATGVPAEVSVYLGRSVAPAPTPAVPPGPPGFPTAPQVQLPNPAATVPMPLNPPETGA